MSGATFKNSTKAMLFEAKKYTAHASPISSVSCQCCQDDFSADDSSSLGYGSGHSSTYSDSVEAQIDDFYRNSHSATPTSRRVELDEAEFYDLDSVDNFSLGSFNCEDTDEKCMTRSSCISLPTLPHQTHRSDALSDFDLVEPSELLRRSFSSKLQISDTSSPKIFRTLGNGRQNRDRFDSACSPDFNSALHCIPEDHIYEEVHYDTTDLNLEGVRPPPLPKRTYCHPQFVKRKILPMQRRVSCQEIRKIKS